MAWTLDRGVLLAACMLTAACLGLWLTPHRPAGWMQPAVAARRPAVARPLRGPPLRFPTALPGAPVAAPDRSHPAPIPSPGTQGRPAAILCAAAALATLPAAALALAWQRRPRPPPLALWATAGEKDDQRSEAKRQYELERPWGLFIIFNLVTWGLIVAASLPTSVRDALEKGDVASLAGNAVFLLLLLLFLQRRVTERSKRIAAIEKELQLGELAVEMRNRLGGTRVTAVRELRGKARVALLFGNAARLRDDVRRAAAYRRRFAEVGLLVVPVVSDPDDGAVEELRRADLPGSWQWLAAPVTTPRWVEHFKGLLPTGSASDALYVTFGATGRVRGSGAGIPRWDVLLSTFPRDCADLPGAAAYDAGEATVQGATPEDAAALLAAHRAFYAALGAGDTAAMAGLWADPGATDPVISGCCERGARMDGWETLLREDRRPPGMAPTDADVLVEADAAWVTAVEALPGGGTLLATQRFQRTADGWALIRHRTVPWGKVAAAPAVLRCDGRGCVALSAVATTSYPTPGDD
eukprot:EG_transcript_8247